jgi:mRNA interferase MazF
MERGDIILVQLPQPDNSPGREQTGTRPALVAHSNETNDTLSVIMIVPFTSNLNAQRFPHAILVQPSRENGLSVPSVLLIFQLRAIDKQRVTKKLGHLDEKSMSQVNQELKKLLGL